MATSIAGSSSGRFVAPAPSSASISGTGTDTIVFGEPAPGGPGANRLTFVGSSFSGSPGTPFRIGTLSYFNGATYTDSDLDSVGLKITTAFSEPSREVISDAFTLDLVTTVNTGDPDGDADYLDLPSAFGSSTFSIDGAAYKFALTGFGNVVGDGFLASSDTQLHVREGGTARADLFGTLVRQGPAVPEPATWTMMIVGFGAVGCAMRRRPGTARLFA